MADFDWWLTIEGTTYPLGSLELQSGGEVQARLIEDALPVTCDLCQGEGYRNGGAEICGRCMGSGVVPRERFLTADDLPADKRPQQLPDYDATDIEVPDHIEDANAREAINAALWDVREREPRTNVTRVADYVMAYLQAARLWEY